MTNQKPLLIINCCASKNKGTHKAYDLYKGSIYTLINNNCDDIHKYFEVMILSGLHGLIDADIEIDDYNREMPDINTQEMSDYINEHRAATVKTLQDKLTAGRRVYICLVNKYQYAFDEMTSKGLKGRFKALNYSYISRNAGGIGYLRSRVLGIVKSEMNRAEIAPVIFRSGVANADECIGYMSANCNIGTSLAYFSKKPFLNEFLAQSLNKHDAFLDNGIITQIKKGKFVSPSEVFATYKNIINGLTETQAKRLSIVIPDHLLSPSLSLNVCQDYTSIINWLSSRCQVILVVHKSQDIVKHALTMLEALNYPSNIMLGIPSRLNIDTNIKSIGKIDPRLELSDIEKLLALKVPIKPQSKIKRKAWSNVHFLGLCEYSGQAYTNRLNLASMYGYNNAHFDTNRTPALMGNEKTSNLLGSKNLRIVKDAINYNKTIKTTLYQQYDIDNEWDESIIYQELDRILETSISVFLLFWNAIYKKTHMAFSTYDVERIKSMPEDEAKEYLDDLITRVDSCDLIKRSKSIMWMKFLKQQDEATNYEKRIAAICRCMLLKGEKPLPIMMPKNHQDSLPSSLRHIAFYLPEISYQ
ncbi:hypothetical protein C9J21_20370 [Photobacterium phosphoreum]|uniref:DUF6884 domain-containing protein n=1 Tax=Photobacterium phosphoreum TaxID=659 RepID=UPI000D16BBE2|nr:DUF6884 domain-containing protein [Photobacterium phosphoreum]PSW28705.1 hypothetical protein C9J21_20370 [Photobacterium phosphoreum]